MSARVLCRLVFSSALPPDELESLTSAIELTSAQVQKTPVRAVGLDDVALLVTIAVGVGQLSEYGVKLTQAIVRWRSQAREKGEEISGKLERPETPSLDLGSATEEEIREWLSR